MEQFPIHSECLYFINPGELHSIITESAGSYEDAVVFSPDTASVGVKSRCSESVASRKSSDALMYN
mgnify:CR=1 FL=1